MFTFALAGLLAGSFLNVLIDRFPRGESIFAIRSQCDSCGERVRIAHLIPIFGSIFARRHSRFCGAHFPIRHWAVEIGTTALFALIWLQYPGTWETMLVAFYSSLLIVFFVIDLEKGLVLDRVAYPAIAVALLFALRIPERSALEMLAGGTIAFGILAAIELLLPSGKGMGVAKLGAFIGLAVGFPTIWAALLFASFFGVLIYGGLMLTRVIDRKRPIAIGSLLAAGAIAAMLFGELIIRWGESGFGQMVNLLST